MIHPRQLCQALAATGAIMLASLATAGDDFHPALTLRAIQVGLERSPEQYLGAVFEVVGDRRCVDPENSSTCASDVKLVEVLAKRGGEFEQGSIVSFGGGGEVGTRYLAFLVPMPNRPDVFGATLLFPRPTPDMRSTFAEQLKAAGL